MQLSDIHAVNPYDGFPISLFDYNAYGWGSDHPGFAELIHEVQPKLIIEVGTWLGGSAIHMTNLARAEGIFDVQVVTVDTWLGSLEFWQDQDDKTRYKALQMVFGYPSIYQQFLANVIHQGLEKNIIPFPITSSIASRWFAWKKVQADLIYVDGSHDAPDVLLDMQAYWPLVRPGGILFGDDLDTFLDVNRALETFEKEISLKATIHGRQWRIKKPR